VRNCRFFLSFLLRKLTSKRTGLRKEGSRKLDTHPKQKESAVHCQLQAGAQLFRHAHCCAAFAVVF
jgi:hypothetical protein